MPKTQAFSLIRRKSLSVITGLLGQRQEGWTVLGVKTGKEQGRTDEQNSDQGGTGVEEQKLNGIHASCASFHSSNPSKKKTLYYS